MLRLTHALEAVVRYLALVIISDYLQQGAFHSETNQLLATRIRRSLPLGLWMELLRETAIPFFRLRKESRPRELVPLLFVERGGRPKPSEFLRCLEELIEFRNRLAHPTANPAEGLGQCLDRFWSVLGALDFLSKYPLVVPMRTDPADLRTITAVIECMGPERAFPYRECQIDIPGSEGARPIAMASPVLLDATGKCVLLNLYPLTLFEPGLTEEKDALYRYDRSNWAGIQTSRVTFAPHQMALPELEVNAHGSREHVLRDFERRFASILTSPTTTFSGPLPRSDFRIPSLEAEIDALHSGFIGRLADYDRLQKQLTRQDRGYLCYQAPTRIGKSAFAAYLIREQGWVGHLVKRQSQRDQPARFLKSLLGQLVEFSDPGDKLPDGSGALEDLLFGVLEQASERLKNQPPERRVVIVFDGLNFLPPEATISFLFETLPSRVFFVLFSQPCALIKDLRRRVKTPWTDLSLETLVEKDVQEFVNRSGVILQEDVRKEIIREANGFPDYLEQILRCLRNARPWTDAKADLQDQYRQVIDRVCAVEVRSSAERLLGLLCVSFEPFSLEVLAQLVQTGSRQVRQLLEPLQPHLLQVDRTVGLFHERFRQTLEEELPRETLDWCRREIVRWSQQESEVNACGVMV